MSFVGGALISHALEEALMLADHSGSLAEKSVGEEMAAVAGQRLEWRAVDLLEQLAAGDAEPAKVSARSAAGSIARGAGQDGGGGGIERGPAFDGPEGPAGGQGRQAGAAINARWTRRL
jgi:hypothetical protein